MDRRLWIGEQRANIILPESGHDLHLRWVSYRRLDTLMDIAGAGYFCQITCRCGHQVRVDPMKLVLRLSRRGADTRLTRLNRSMKCGRCGGKDFTAVHCEGPAVWSKG